MRSKHCHSPKAVAEHPEDSPRPPALVVEPDGLTRWSLQRFLERWFVVDGVETPRDAERLLLIHRYSAVVISDDFSLPAVERMARSAHESNPAAPIVVLASGAGAGPNYVARLEKPFDLHALARILGLPADGRTRSTF